MGGSRRIDEIVGRLGVAAIACRQEYQPVSGLAEHALESHADAKRQIGTGDVSAAFEPGESVVHVAGVERARHPDERPDFCTETRHRAQPLFKARNRRDSQDFDAELNRLRKRRVSLRPGL